MKELQGVNFPINCQLVGHFVLTVHHLYKKYDLLGMISIASTLGIQELALKGLKHIISKQNINIPTPMAHAARTFAICVYFAEKDSDDMKFTSLMVTTVISISTLYTSKKQTLGSLVFGLAIGYITGKIAAWMSGSKKYNFALSHLLKVGK
ncbi:MAG: hypothetical protein L0207_05180 [Chlamydiae bacterium]|nr:hypothetical protein [Chlamydiota bacterium]